MRRPWTGGHPGIMRTLPLRFEIGYRVISSTSRESAASFILRDLRLLFGDDGRGQ